MQNLEGRTAFVTGGASGIGLGLVRALLAEGCKVAIADVREDAIAAALATLDNREVMGVALDVASRTGFAAAADRVEAEFGPVSLLFNNAGVNLFQPIEESSYDDWDWVLGVNLGGVVNGVATFVPRMQQRGGDCHIVNTASMAAFLCGPSAGIYNTAKAAVRGLSESLRYSLAPHGIGVSLLLPGLVKSQIHASDAVRPDALKANAKASDPVFAARLASVHAYGMEPDVIAARVLQAVREDRFYIFSHPEFREELSEVFDEILEAFQEYPADPGLEQRLGFEATRRERYAEARRSARGARR